MDGYSDREGIEVGSINLFDKFGLGGASFNYYPICSKHFTENREMLFKKFAGKPVMVNLVSPEFCNVCNKNGDSI